MNDELAVHAQTARKLLKNEEWTPTRLLWSRLVDHLDAALAAVSSPVAGAVADLVGRLRPLHFSKEAGGLEVASIQPDAYSILELVKMTSGGYAFGLVIHTCNEERMRWNDMTIHLSQKDAEQLGATLAASALNAYATQVAALEKQRYELEKKRDELRRVIAELRGFDKDTWPTHRNIELAIAATFALALKEQERLEKWVADLQSGRYVNCVYCGHRYGPGETTPVSMADTLKAHIETCPEHPLSHERARADRLEAELSAVRGALDLLVTSVDGVLVELRPGQSLSPSGAGRTNALVSARNEARSALATGGVDAHDRV